MENQSENKKKIAVTTVVLITVFVALVAAIVGGLIGHSLRPLNENKPVEVKSPSNLNGTTSTNTTSLNTTNQTSNATNSSTSSSTVDTSSWKTYSNTKYNIRFNYPAEATIKEDDFSNDPTFESFCVTVNYKVTYVSIQTKATNLCHRTGIAYDGVTRNETVTLSGKQYQAKGFEEQGPGDTIDVHNETLSFTGPRSLEIEYGTYDPNVSAGHSQYTFSGDYQKARPTMIAILETIQ